MIVLLSFFLFWENNCDVYVVPLFMYSKQLHNVQQTTSYSRSVQQIRLVTHAVYSRPDQLLTQCTTDQVSYSRRVQQTRLVIQCTTDQASYSHSVQQTKLDTHTVYNRPDQILTQCATDQASYSHSVQLTRLVTHTVYNRPDQLLTQCTTDQTSYSHSVQLTRLDTHAVYNRPDQLLTQCTTAQVVHSQSYNVQEVSLFTYSVCTTETSCSHRVQQRNVFHVLGILLFYQKKSTRF